MAQKIQQNKNLKIEKNLNFAGQNYKQMEILKEQIKNTWKIDPEDFPCE